MANPSIGGTQFLIVDGFIPPARAVVKQIDAPGADGVVFRKEAEKTEGIALRVMDTFSTSTALKSGMQALSGLVGQIVSVENDSGMTFSQIQIIDVQIVNYGSGGNSSNGDKHWCEARVTVQAT